MPKVENDKSEKVSKEKKDSKDSKDSKDKKPEKSTTKKVVTFNSGSVWPSEVLAAYKLHGKKMCRIETGKPKSYGEGTRKITTYPKKINVSTNSDEEEWHPVNIEFINSPTSGWVSGVFDKADQNSDTKSKKDLKSKKKSKDDDEEEKDEDGGNKPKIQFAKSTKFMRPDSENDGKEIEEPFGEAIWLLSELFQEIITGYFDEKNREMFKKTFGSRKKEQFNPFKLYRKAKEEDDSKDIVTVGGVDKIKLEDPYFEVNIRCTKAGEVATAIKDITDKTKIKQKGDNFVFPEAKIGGNPLTVKTLGKFITPGSLCTGIISFDQVKTHSFGFSQSIELGWQKLSAADEKAQQVLIVKRVAQEGGQTKMDNKSRTMAMLGTVDVGGAEDSEDEKEEAKKKAQKEMIKSAKNAKGAKNEKDNKSDKKSKSKKDESESDSKSEESEESNNDDSDASDSKSKSEESEESEESDGKSKKNSKNSKNTKNTKNTKNSKKDSKGKEESKKDSKSKKSDKSKKDSKGSKSESSTESADGSSSGSSASVSDIPDDE